MKKSFSAILLCAVFCCAALFSSCSKKDKEIEFQRLEDFATDPGVEWLLVTSPYVACHKDSGYEADVINHLRRGDIRKIDGSAQTKVDDAYETWFYVEEGWIPQNSAQVYSNRLRAVTAAKSLN